MFRYRGALVEGVVEGNRYNTRVTLPNGETRTFWSETDALDYLDRLDTGEGR